MKLSLCIIVKNEATNLPRCLASVQEVVDELVVLDTGSEDGTVAIAQEYGAAVHHFDWCDDFAAARNACLAHATGDWILVLDADEVLNEAIVPTMHKAMQKEDVLVINLVRQEIGATQSPYSLVSRLFRKHPAIEFTRPYHAMIDDSVATILTQEPQWQVVGLSEVAILHYGYEPEMIASRNKMQKARMTMERYLILHPGDPYVCSKLGALYVEMGRPQHGMELLERGLRSPQVDPSICYELHYHLGIAYSQTQHIPQAAEQYVAAIKQPILSKLKVGAYNNLGALRQKSGDLDGARKVYKKLLQIDPNFAIAHYNLGMVMKGLGKLNDAIAHYQKAIELNPDYAEAHQNLGVALLKVGKPAESIDAFRKAILLHQQRVPQEAERLRIHLESMGFEV